MAVTCGWNDEKPVRTGDFGKLRLFFIFFFSRVSFHLSLPLTIFLSLQFLSFPFYPLISLPIYIFLHLSHISAFSSFLSPFIRFVSLLFSILSPLQSLSLDFFLSVPLHLSISRPVCIFLPFVPISFSFSLSLYPLISLPFSLYSLPLSSLMFRLTLCKLGNCETERISI
jgi:hypothetical protein